MKRTKNQPLFVSCQLLVGRKNLFTKLTCSQHRSIDLHWDCPHKKVRFALAVWPEGKQIILLSTDVTLSPTEIVTAYSWRFKIEVTGRSFIQLLSGFSYRFWMKEMTPTKGWPIDLVLARYKEKKQQQVNRKVEAFEGIYTNQCYCPGHSTTS